MAAPNQPSEYPLGNDDVLVVVFDGAKARFLTRESNGRLTPMSELESGLYHFSRDAMSDKPGRSFASAGVVT